MPLALFLLGAVCAVLLLAAIAAFYFLRPQVRFRALLRVADAMRAKGDLPGAIKLAEHLLMAPPHVQKSAGPHLRYTLAFWYLEAGRAEAAEEACRHVLRHKMTPAWEAKVRRRLAQSLDNQERDDEAKAEEEKADALLREAEAGVAVPMPQQTPLILLGKAERLADETRFAEAAQAYEEVLGHTEHWHTSDAPLKNKTMVQAALAHYQCGHYAQTVRWAEAALENGADGLVRLMALRSAGIGCMGLGQWDKARIHKEAALALSRDMGNAEQIARSLVGLANLEQQFGHITHAMALLEEASQTGGTLVKFDVCVGQARMFSGMGPL